MHLRHIHILEGAQPVSQGSTRLKAKHLNQGKETSQLFQPPVTVPISQGRTAMSYKLLILLPAVTLRSVLLSLHIFGSIQPFEPYIRAATICLITPATRSFV